MGSRILVVEDSAVIRRLIEVCLRAADLEIVTRDIDGRYVDPIPQMGCVSTDITRALRLVTPPQPYPRTRANRNLGWNVRSDPYRPSARRRGVAEPGKSRPSSLHAGGRPMAEI